MAGAMLEREDRPGTRHNAIPGQESSQLVCCMKKLLTRLWFLILASLVLAAGGILLSASRQESLWIAIAGTLLTLLGAIAACRKVLRLGWAESFVSNVPRLGGGILPTEDDIDQARQKDLDERASLLASVMVVLGTSLQVIAYLSRT